ncbi:MAG: mechanosensitive ion channel family protein [Alphaproteobacteria bacterium]|nr:mechanosensitive ion channel family protein [Alphaproteobacteria bacterium]
MMSVVFSETVTLNQGVIALAIFIVVVLIGIIFDRIMIFRIKKLTLKTPWAGDDIIVGALESFATWLGLIVGLYAASRILPLLPSIKVIIQRAIWVLIIIWATMYVGRVVAGFLRYYGEKSSGMIPKTSILSNVARIIIFCLGFLVILQSLGVSVTPLLTALGVGGLAVALALQSSLSNIFAGIQLLASKYIHTGDYVRLSSGDEGYITDISWRSTSIRALPNRIIVIPNSVLADSIVNNYTLPEKEVALLIDMSVSYDSDLRHVERVTIEVATEIMKNITGGIPAFNPLIRFNKFGDSGIGFTVVIRSEEFANQFLLKHEFIKAVHSRYRRENIEIPYPVRVVKIQPSNDKKKA